MAHKGLPHNAILNYTTNAASSATWAAGGVTNFAKDYSMLNRQHWEQTTRQGVPLVYRMALTVSPSIRSFADDGLYSDIFNEDVNLIQIVAFRTAQQNWVQRNGCVKLHHAREKQFSVQGIKKSDRGAYDKTMHIAWDASPGGFLTPWNGDRNDYTDGSWEYSKIILPNDTGGAYINVVDSHGDEESTTAFTTLSIPQMYLASRQQVEADTNSEADDQPKKFSVLNILREYDAHHNTMDEIIDLVRDNQDEPPYDLTDVNGNDCKKIEAGRCFLGVSSGLQKTMVIDVPYGLMEIGILNSYIDTGANLTIGVDIKAEVLDIFPMGEF